MAVRISAFSSRLRSVITTTFQHRSARILPNIHNVKFGSSARVLSSPTDNNASRPVSRYDYPDVKSLPDDIQEKMQQVESKWGFLPNPLKVYSRRPAEFRAFVDYYGALMYDKEGSNLTEVDKQMIAVATSAADNCLYNVLSHSAIHRTYSGNPILADQIATNWELAELTSREKAILKFAMKVCHSESITEDHFSELEEHGLNKEDAWDIGAVVALLAMTNRMAHVTGVRPNDEYYLFGRIKKE